MPEELHKIETIQSGISGGLDRIRVAGGWLYRAKSWPGGMQAGASVSMVFVPDPPLIKIDTRTGPLPPIERPEGYNGR